ncbi:hypothetical protein [Demequina activiva]|uniref:Uncharacterized protein n=1 Tax=Demequina activiva TaxID=1582364 RepID=A0A919Q4I6_9MICO|nr:hypothetical protein [Demequina activiva]GIG54153.1 hypothetical protein Dac01nite_09050 [Demequina activiva]
MELLVILAVGVMLGWGVSMTHPLVNAGPVIGAAAGAVGAWLGSRALGGIFAPLLTGHELAGEVAGAAVGAMVLAAIAGGAVLALRGRRR